MQFKDIQELIKGGETKCLELKKSTGELKDAMHTACAFLNSEGGWLIIGVTPNALRIVGQEVTDNTRREIAQAVTGFEPSVDVNVDYIDIPSSPGKQVIAMHFPQWVWGMRPYTFHGRPYYKVESTTKIMPRDMFEDRIRQSWPQTNGWDAQEAVGIRIADLDEDRIRSAVRYGIEVGKLSTKAEGEPVIDLLDKFGLLRDGKPNNAAVVLFAKNVTQYPQLLVRMARFRGNNKM